MPGKVAPVTGPSRHIGRAVAGAFARRGLRVVLNARTSAGELEVAAADVRAAGHDVLDGGGEPHRFAALPEQTPLRRAGRVEDVAEAVAWLASDDAACVNGTTIGVNGGRSA